MKSLKKPYLGIVITLVVILLVTSLALAQSLGGYDLSWWTSESGASTSGDGYNLHGVIRYRIAFWMPIHPHISALPRQFPKRPIFTLWVGITYKYASARNCSKFPEKVIQKYCIMKRISGFIDRLA